MSTSVTFEKATRIYPGTEKPAVDALDLEIAEGEFLVLVGPSGCGKSTSLRMLAGLEEVNAGHIRIGDRDVTDLQPKDRDIAMVFQNYALYPHMSVSENMGFALKLAGTPKDEIRRRVAEAARILDLAEYLERKPKALSGGQRQRVAMGRAIVREPQVFLMDEPLSNLDAKLRVQTRAELIELQRRLEATVVYVTHDQVEAMTMGHRIAIMNEGVLQQVGPPQDVYDRPANVFVARFIGSPAMNTFAGRVDDSRTNVVVRSGAGALPLPPGVERKAGTVVTIGVRPEAFRIADDGPIKANVTLVESLGHERQVLCRLEGGTDIVIVRLAADAPAPDDGDAITLTARAVDIHLFDDETGDRLG
jgi:multiple sugar transport system ATP-binding protein